MKEIKSWGWDVTAHGKPIRSAGGFDIKVSTGVDWFALDARIPWAEQLASSLPELLAAQACGVSLVYYKSLCFVIAALVSGFAGALYAHEARYLSPNDFSFLKSMDILIMIVIGGVGSVEGAILGAAVVVLLPEYLHVVDNYRMVIYGAVLVGAMFVGTGGLASPLQRLMARFGHGR